jgi:hypothetical protein
VYFFAIPYLLHSKHCSKETGTKTGHDQDERNLLENATPQRKRQTPHNLKFYIRALARLGGYLDRASDPPPGTTVIWRGFSRLADLVEGARIATSPLGTCG